MLIFEGKYNVLIEDGRNAGCLVESDPDEWLYIPHEEKPSLSAYDLRLIADQIEKLEANGECDK